MSHQQFLAESFDYDLWANLRWLKFLPHATPEEGEVFAHILMAQKMWAERVNGNSPTVFPVVDPTVENLRFLHQNWIDLIASHDAEEIIHYKRTTGEAKSLTFHQIARQVANHGTYHRGQMRGLCQIRNCTDFPETDFLHYYWSL